ncbi:MAG: TadE/TadG family type IV pilus assembly protein [Alsobacter sp.]
MHSHPIYHRALLSRLWGMLGRWRRDDGGSFGVALAIALVPLIGALGGAVDLAYYYRVKTKLDIAADAALLAVVGNSAMQTDPVAAQRSGEAIFAAEAGDPAFVRLVTTKLDITDNGLTRTATLSYAGSYATRFIQILGIRSLDLQGSATSSIQKSPFIDFYLLLDNTPSMGVGATTADIDKMVANTSDKCAFACHDASNKNDYYSLAKKLGVTMRIDVVRQATQQLIDTAQQTSVDGQYRVAIYTYGQTAASLGLKKNAPLTSNLPNAKSQAGDIDLMIVPNSTFNNDMDSPHESVLAGINAEIPAPGDGSSAASPQKILFLVSDGVTDADMPAGCTRPLSGSKRCQQPLNPAQCTAIKNRGVKIAVLYTTYLPLPTNSWYKTWISPFQTTISSNMQACSSPGLFFEVSPSQGIADAMLALFTKATLAARLTK